MKSISSLLQSVWFWRRGQGSVDEHARGRDQARSEYPVTCKDSRYLTFIHSTTFLFQPQRLAMLACVGWPLAELFDKPIAESIGMPALLTKSGESPSVINGGLEKIDLAYWAGVFSLAGIIELENMKMKEEKGKNYIPGDCNFDPLGLLPKERDARFNMQLKEIKNGRLAMMAIFGFVAQEALYGMPVVQETPMFFTPAAIF